MMKDGGEPPPDGIRAADGEWHVPVQFGINAASEAEAAAFALDHNGLVLAGGDGFSTFDFARLFDWDKYISVLAELIDESALPTVVDGEDLDLLMAAPANREKHRGSKHLEKNRCPQCGFILNCIH